MKSRFYVRKICEAHLYKSIENVGFDKSYIENAIEKYRFERYLIQNLTPPQATIIKQTALSLGADAAIHREVITCKVDKTDLILGCTNTQLQRIAEKLKLQPFNLRNLAEELKKINKIELISIKLRKKEFDWAKKSYIMGILNITPDSFSDGGKFTNLENALNQVKSMVENNVDIIDIGGESTRPYSKEIHPDEEIKRITPVIKAIREEYPDIILSIDTRNSKTAYEAIKNGADIINDVSGFDKDENMLKTVKELNVPIIIMHSLGTPETMQINPTYQENVINSIYKSLYEKVHLAIDNGIKKENIIIDPGIGFGKTQEHNIEIIRRIEEFKTLGVPILAGVSRKSVISNIINVPPCQRDEATLALNSYLISKGANIIRVHNVSIHNSAVKVLNEVLNSN